MRTSRQQKRERPKKSEDFNRIYDDYQKSINDWAHNFITLILSNDVVIYMMCSYAVIEFLHCKKMLDWLTNLNIPNYDMNSLFARWCMIQHHTSDMNMIINNNIDVSPDSPDIMAGKRFVFKNWKSIIPFHPKPNAGLKYDLLKNDKKESEIQQIELHLKGMCTEALQEIRMSELFLQRDFNLEKNEQVSKWFDENSNYHVSYKGIMFDLTKEIYENLKNKFIYQNFLDEHIYVLLARYNAVGGEIYQGTISSILLETLRRILQIKGECFASPLNTQSEWYCSAFDIDKVFGSKGSFFKIHETSNISSVGGSFEANPPFIEEIMLAMFHYITMLLQYETPFSFCIILPCWTDTPAIKLLNSCEFTKFKTTIKGIHMPFKSGMHYLPAKKDLMINYTDYFIYVVQNKLGNEKWPIEEISAHFSKK